MEALQATTQRSRVNQLYVECHVSTRRVYTRSSLVSRVTSVVTRVVSQSPGQSHVPCRCRLRHASALRMCAHDRGEKSHYSTSFSLRHAWHFRVPRSPTNGKHRHARTRAGRHPVRRRVVGESGPGPWAPGALGLGVTHALTRHAVSGCWGWPPCCRGQRAPTTECHWIYTSPRFTHCDTMRWCSSMSNGHRAGSGARR